MQRWVAQGPQLAPPLQRWVAQEPQLAPPRSPLQKVHRPMEPQDWVECVEVYLDKFRLS